ncbi:head completion/stabilization protein [Burkholderia pseudomallei]|uniref:head completion/stabilization protein n=1 Tax=Burkholderia pseudomallei TaxID=28450 RepID=UPI001035B535|nr:hypothetical protein EXY72_16915 [Burkholderia pseudomallei]
MEGTLTNDGFFPDIDLSALRDAMRLDGTVTAERLRHAARDALLTVNDELAAWRARQRAAGAATLADVPAPRIDGESAHVARYRRAVYHLTHADVTEKYRGYDSQVQQRVAGLFWLEIAYCSDRTGAEAAIRAAVIARRRARLKPRVLGLFDRDGQALGQ